MNLRQRLVVVMVGALVCIIGLSVWLSPTPASEPTSTAALNLGIAQRNPLPFAAGDKDDPRERDKWFWRQRTYPWASFTGLDVAVHKAAIATEVRRARTQARTATGNWTELGPGPVVGLGFGGGTRQDASGRALAIAIHPTNADIVLVGAAQGGIWRSTTGGANGSFAAVADEQPSLAIKVIRFAQSNPNVVYAGTGEPHGSTGIFGAGVLKSTDAGASWTQLPISQSAGISTTTGWSFEYAAVSGLQVDPTDPNIVYATTANIAPSINAFLPPNGSPVKTGIFKSLDGGLSWTQVYTADDFGFTTNFGFMDLESGGVISPNVLYASEYRGGIYKSVDAGVSWTRMTPVQSNGRVGVLPATVSDFYYYDAANGRFQLYTRTPPATGAFEFNRIELGVAASNPDIIYAGYSLDRQMILTGLLQPVSVGLLFKSTDGGATWQWLGDWPRNSTPQYCSDQCDYDNVVLVNPTNANDVIVGGSANYNQYWPDPVSSPTRIVQLPWRGMVHRSLDGGQSWLDITPHYSATYATCTDTGQTYGAPPLSVYNCPSENNHPSKVIHPDVQGAAYDVANNRIYIADDGGLHRASLVAGGAPTNSLDYEWENLNAGLGTMQFYNFDVHPTDPNKIIGGMQDNAVAYYTGTLAWDGWGQGDGSLGAFDPLTPTIVYYGSQHSVYRHDNGGEKDAFNGWTQILGQTSLPGGQVGFIPTFAIDPVDSRTLYAATNNQVFRSDDRGGNWTAVGATTAPATSISVSPRDRNLVWVGAENGEVYLYNLGANTFVNKTAAPLPGRYLTRIAASPVDTDTVFAVFSGYDVNTPGTPGKVFKSANQGGAWVDVSGNLPDVPVSALALDPNNANRLWVGNDIGVYETTNGGATWTPIRNNMPIVAVVDMRYNATTSYLNVATHGRGIWRVNPSAGTVALTSATLTGPTTGFTDTLYTFNVSVTPANATPPITYTWMATNQSPVAPRDKHTPTDSYGFTWNVTGTQRITVTAENISGTVTSNVHLITIAERGAQQFVYLPLIVR
jgi:hypothetical protein